MGNVSRDAMGTIGKSIKLSIEGKTKPMDCRRNARSSTESAKDARGLLHPGPPGSALGNAPIPRERSGNIPSCFMLFFRSLLVVQMKGVFLAWQSILWTMP